MARLPDEQWDMIEDSINKKRTAQSARHRRTHCGKSGSVKFPSDYMTKKELKQMNSECKSYRLNEPMSWNEFKELPDDLKRDYVKLLRSKYSVPDKDIAEMLGINRSTFCKWMKCLGLSLNARTGLKSDAWKESEQGIAFYKWLKKEEMTENMPKIDDITVKTDSMPVVSSYLSQYAMPKSGSLHFECPADDAINMIHSILQNNKVCLDVQWTLMKED